MSAKQVVEMKPQALSDFKTSPNIQRMATVLSPRESEPPILKQAVRESVFAWMAELNAVEELKGVNLEPRRKMIFYGPPGTGKTTLAHHIAARLGLVLVVANMQQVGSMYMGETARNIDDLFRDLGTQSEHCILFLDEFDALSTKRGDGGSKGDNDNNRTVIALLQKMDAWKGFLIAATNRNDSIDHAIWRRFEMHLHVDVPDADGRFAILKRYFAPLELEDDFIGIVASNSGGVTPANLRKLCESIKRDLVLGPKIKLPTDCHSVVVRAVQTAALHADVATPPLWADTQKITDELKEFWPPKIGEK